ncbi:diguanylate cyclase [Bacillus cereus]|uniref:GGDEF domain-containing protein n=1 Tax=Bacillus cereus TaxID=1396 RepID=UPI0018F27BED|nr:diguanylate cyclase [Bacillus cereus]MBJ8055385.1 diguanylate cyclase [Bacillus cereus]
MGVPIPKSTIYDSELNVLRSEATLDLLMRKTQKHKNLFVLFLDIDGSREVRNRGIVLRLDLVQRLRKLLEKNMAPTSHCLWFGNDEFVVTIEALDMNSAIEEAERLRKIVEDFEFDFFEPVEKLSFKGKITVTGGLVDANDKHDVIDVLRHAKRRLAIGKVKGKNQINIEGDIQLIDKKLNITTNQMNILEKISHQRNRDIECLIREAIDTLFVHYPQFHGHRNDMETKQSLETAFLYACSPTGLYVNNSK